MKFLILTLFVAVATAAPLEDDNGPVELIVNGVPEGQPIDLSSVVDIKVKEHEDGHVVAATNLLHPYTAVGIAEATAAAAAANPGPVSVVEVSESESIIIPVPVVLPSPVAPEVVLPEPVVLPSPVAPEVVLPEPVVLPSPVAPEVVPEPVVLPSPVAPEVVISAPEPVVLPSPVAPEIIQSVPASVANGEIFSDGTVSVSVSTPQEAGVLSSIQSWFSLVLNYFNDGAQTTHQVV